MTNEEKVNNGMVGNTGLSTKDYGAIHRWLLKTLGKATYCSHCKVSDKLKYEWALIKGQKYEKLIENFIPLCCSCHRKYDETDIRRAKLSKSLSGNSNCIKPVIATKNGVPRSFPSIVGAAKELNISRTAISNVLINRSKTAGGFTWLYQTKNY